MASILAVRLFGPMAGWGTLASGAAVRDTARHPGRGAILGMAAAALGIARDDGASLEALGIAVSVAVASHGPRRVRADFRTIQTVEGGRRATPFASRAEALATGLKVHTTVQHRYHVEDGLWRVFLAQRPGAAPRFVASALRDAFLKPEFEIYLGRREFPLALPLDPVVQADAGLEGALEVFPAIPAVPGGRAFRALADAARLLEWKIVGAGDFDLCWDADFPGAPASGRSRLVVDDPASRVAWRFGEREERYATGLKPTRVTEESLVNEFFG